MLQQIYNLQGEHTAKYHSSRLDSINRKINKQPPPRHILQQRMKEVLEKKKAGRAQPAIKAESGVNSSESDAGLPFARPAAARSAEQPVKLEAKSSAASSVRFTTAPTAPVLQAHAAKASSRSALDDARRSLGLTPLSQAGRPKVESTAVPEDPPQVLNSSWRFEAQRSHQFVTSNDYCQTRSSQTCCRDFCICFWVESLCGAECRGPSKAATYSVRSAIGSRLGRRRQR